MMSRGPRSSFTTRQVGAAGSWYRARDPKPFAHSPACPAPRLDLAGIEFAVFDRSAGGSNRAATAMRGALAFGEAIDRCRAALQAHFEATGEPIPVPAMSGDVATDIGRLNDALQHHANHGGTATSHSTPDEGVPPLLFPLVLQRHPEWHERALRSFAEALNHHVGLRVRVPQEATS